mgnify:CR=1 FL=1
MVLFGCRLRPQLKNNPLKASAVFHEHIQVIVATLDMEIHALYNVAWRNVGLARKIYCLSNYLVTCDFNVSLAFVLHVFWRHEMVQRTFVSRTK